MKEKNPNSLNQCKSNDGKCTFNNLKAVSCKTFDESSLIWASKQVFEFEGNMNDANCQNTKLPIVPINKYKAHSLQLNTYRDSFKTSMLHLLPDQKNLQKEEKCTPRYYNYMKPQAYQRIFTISNKYFQTTNLLNKYRNKHLLSLPTSPHSVYPTLKRKTSENATTCSSKQSCDKKLSHTIINKTGTLFQNQMIKEMLEYNHY